MAYYRRYSRQSMGGAALFFAALALIMCPFFLYRGLTFHLSDEGPGTIDSAFATYHGRGYDYGGYLTVTSTGKQTKESDGSKDNIYNLLEDQSTTDSLPVQHIEVDTTDGSPYSFQYQGSTYHVEGSRDTELV